MNVLFEKAWVVWALWGSHPRDPEVWICPSKVEADKQAESCINRNCNAIEVTTLSGYLSSIEPQAGAV